MTLLIRIALVVGLGYAAWTHPHSALLVVAGYVAGPRLVREIQG